MTKNKDGEDVLSSLKIPIDGGDPKVCVQALARIADEMMKVLHKERMQGALCLLSAAAKIIDEQCGEWSAQDGNEQSGIGTMKCYTDAVMAAWNAYLVMFKGLDPEAAGMTEFVEKYGKRPDGETLQ